MTEKENLLALFDPQALSPKFEALCEHYFDHDMTMCEGFELYSSHNEALQYFLPASKLEKHRGDFIIFAQATHSGSLYAFYKAAADSKMEDWPLVVFGDEGGALILAKNLDDFLRFLSMNVQPYVGTDYKTDKASFELFMPEEDEEDEGEVTLLDYIEWIENTYKLNRVKTIEQAEKEIIVPAQKAWQGTLDAIVAE